MGAYYQNIDKVRFDYELQRLPGIPNEMFRGPAFEPGRRYGACIGAAQTFGRFCARPYPRILSALCNLQFLNLGVGGAGPRHFTAPHYLDYLNNAEFVIVQVMAARSESNSLFDNSKEGGLFGHRIRDGRRMRFEDFLSELVESEENDLVTKIVRETQQNYVNSYIRLLNQIQRPKLLLWISNRSPDHPEDLSWKTVGAFPQLVNRSMVDQIRQYSDSYVECVSAAGIPEELWSADEAIDGARLEGGKLMNYYYPSAAMHMQAALAAAPFCRRFDRDGAEISGTEDPLPAEAGAETEITKFVILGAERTGSDLLRGLLDSHPQCFVGHELFNQVYFDEGYIPWYIDSQTGSHDNPANRDAELVELRAKDPARLIQRLAAMAQAEGYRAAGFKLMYFHADSQKLARDYLRSARNIRIIHLKRRNLLRRLLSLKRAQMTSQWNVGIDSPTCAAPQVDLSLMECVLEFSDIQRQEEFYDELFKEHAVLNVYYEELAEDPQGEGARIAAFLGLTPSAKFDVRVKKLATDRLEDAVQNYSALKDIFSRWAACFDE